MPLNLVGKIALRVGALAVMAALAGCATPPPADDPEAVAEFKQINDPIEPTNRAVFAFNEGADKYVIKPVAQGYRYAVPQFGRDRVNDFLENLKSPLYLANDLLQGNMGQAGVTTGRFVMNTTFGVFGIMDVADPAGIPGHKSDFGQTMGVWGIPDGPYIVLPLLGPSGGRDVVGTGVEWFADPVDMYLESEHLKWLSWTRTGVSGVVTREAYLDTLDDVKRTSLDYYSTLRSLYRQRRAAEVNYGKNPGAYNPPAKTVMWKIMNEETAEARK